MTLYLLLISTIALTATACRLAQLLGREMKTTEELRWKLLCMNIREAARLEAVREEEWTEFMNEIEEGAGGGR